jgi:hypothetical protein
VSSVNTKDPKRKGNWNVFGVVCLRTLKAHKKLKGKFKIFKISGVTCPSQGLLIEIMARHL